METNQTSKRFKQLFIATFCLSFSHLPSAFGENRCESAHAPTQGATFLQQKNPTLHTSNSVQHRADHVKNTTGRTLQKPSEKIQAWLDYLDQSYQKYQGNPQALKHIQKYFHDQSITKLDEVPESFYELQVRIARERGLGNRQLTPAQKVEVAQIAINDQKKSLDTWIQYYLSKDSSHLPTWAKYWSLTAVVKMGKFDPETGTFGNRSKTQMSPFPELNREALAFTIDALVKKLDGKSLADIQDPGFINLLDGASFPKLYGKALKLSTQRKHQSVSVEGKWVTFKQGSDHQVLVESLKGMNTGWCIAGESTAQQYLTEGDFHIYYSNDAKGIPLIPRLAIRMTGRSISEVRGTGKDQNLDAQISETPILSRKLAEFGEEGKAYEKKSADMKLLSLIETKSKNGQELTKDEISFLYELKNNIQGFGYQKDPRIEEIRASRHTEADFNKIFEGVEDYFGDLNLDHLKTVQNLIFPKVVHGTIGLPNLESVEGSLVLPRVVHGGDVFLNKLVTLKGVSMSEKIENELWLPSLASIDNSELPKYLGSLSASGLKSLQGITLPKQMKKLDLSGIETAEGLDLSDYKIQRLYLNGLKSAAGLKLSKNSGFIAMFKLESAHGFTIPEGSESAFYLPKLLSESTLTIPKDFKGTIELKDKTLGPKK